MRLFCMDSDFDYVLSELPKRRGKYKIIAKKAAVKYTWLTKVASGAIPNPGVIQIERLARILRQTAETA